jgi:hypothetical protein
MVLNDDQAFADTNTFREQRARIGLMMQHVGDNNHVERGVSEWKPPAIVACHFDWFAPTRKTFQTRDANRGLFLERAFPQRGAELPGAATDIEDRISLVQMGGKKIG